MDFKRKALGVAMGTFAAVAMSLTAAPASAMGLIGNAYYEAGASAGHDSRADRRAARKDKRHERRADDRKDRDGTYDRETDRYKTEDGVGRTTTITNTDTGNSITRERTTTRDPETGAVTHTNEITGPEGEKSLNSSSTTMKTDDGRTTTTNITGPDGSTRSRSADITKDPDSNSATKSVTRTDENGVEKTRETTVTKTDDGYTRSTDFNNGASTDVTATKDPETGEWDRDVTRSRGDASSDMSSSDEVDEDDSSTED
jgi:hypothetical protein